jgi:hypothetical protein
MRIAICTFACLAIATGRAGAQTKPLQTTVATSLSCAPSMNGSGHMICGEGLRPAGGAFTFGGVSWQSQPTTGTPPEPAFTVDTMNSSFPVTTGPFGGTPGCTTTSDASGSVVCAAAGPNGGLYGISTHPQPTKAATAFMPLLLPGTVITAGSIQGQSPCTPTAPCNIVTGLASTPSCAPAGGGGTTVICAVVVNLANVNGAAQPQLVGIAFNPNASVVAGTNPAITALPYTTTYAGNPSCVTVIDHSATNPQNGGNNFAACGIEVMNTAPWSTATIFGVAFDPRSGYARGGLIVSSPTDFVGDPSCATPRDGSTEVICAVGTGNGRAFGSGTFTTLAGFGFDPVGRTTTAIENLGTAPAGAFWTGVGCASPNVPASQNSILCATTTSSNQTFGVLFDPRTTAAVRTSTASVFAPPNGATMPAAPSCISLNVVNNSISCGIVDSTKQSWAFVVPSP